MNGFFLAIGQQGAGKTLLITKLLVDEYRKSKRKVYSNYTLKNGIEYTKITLNPHRTRELGKIPNILEMLDENPNVFNNSILAIDEIHLDLDSLDFMRKNNRRLQVFFSQLRKRNILLLGTTQYIMHVDVRIRRQCKNVFDMSHIKDGIFRVDVNKIDGYYTSFINSYVDNLEPYYKYYDTNEIIY